MEPRIRIDLFMTDVTPDMTDGHYEEKMLGNKPF